MEDLASLGADALRELLATERSTKEALEGEIYTVKLAVQAASREAERREEGVLTSIGKRVRQLKFDNYALAVRIESEKEHVKVTLFEKYEAVLREKEELQAEVERQERYTRGMQPDAERLAGEAAGLAATIENTPIETVEEHLVRLLAKAETWEEERESGFLVLRVSDTGRGMTAEEQQRALNPLPPAESPDARFAGLREAQEIMSSVNGSLRLENRGTLVTVRMPMDPVLFAYAAPFGDGLEHVVMVMVSDATLGAALADWLRDHRYAVRPFAAPEGPAPATANLAVLHGLRHMRAIGMDRVHGIII